MIHQACPDQVATGAALDWKRAESGSAFEVMVSNIRNYIYFVSVTYC